MAFLPPSPCATLNRNLRNLCNLRMLRFRILVGIIWRTPHRPKSAARVRLLSGFV
jgi:hypothetical protein